MSGAASRSELALVAVGLAALTGLVLFLTDGAILFTRPYWVDEWFTVLVTSRSNPFAMLADLANGADGGTGLFHGAIWLVRQVAGSAPVVLRAFSLVCVLGALLLVYALLRRRVGRDAGIVAILAVGSHPLVVAHSYEARFYGPWLLCATFYAWALDRSLEESSPRTSFAQGLAAALLCGVHFYGVISFSLMIAGVLLVRLRDLPATLRSFRPSLAGIAVVAAISPIAVGQKRAYSVASWVAEFELGQLVALAREFWFAGLPIACLIAALIGWLIRRGSDAASPLGVARAIFVSPGIAAITALAAMPLALAVVSLAGQPSMLSRYAIVAALAWAPLAAIVIEYVGRIPGRIARLALIWMWLVAYTADVRAKQFFASEVDEARKALSVASDTSTVVTPSIHIMYPLLADSMGGTARLRFLMLPDSAINRMFPIGTQREALGRWVFTERDLARIHASRFGFPRAIAPASADSAQAFMLLGSPLRLRPAFRDLNDLATQVFPTRQFAYLGADVGLSLRK